MENKRKHISVLVPTYNEAENVEPLCAAIVREFERSLPQYDYDILFFSSPYFTFVFKYLFKPFSPVHIHYLCISILMYCVNF